MLITLFYMDVLLLVNNVLDIHFDVKKLFHFLEFYMVPVLLVIRKHVFGWLIKNSFDVIYDNFKDSMVHL